MGDLLRNDSLLDMSNRGELYRSLFDWLEVSLFFCRDKARQRGRPQRRGGEGKRDERRVANTVWDTS